MYLIQILLPLNDNEGRPFPPDPFKATRRELTEQFSGVTVYSRSPAEGIWDDPSGEFTRDDVILFEVMVPDLNVDWWSSYREALERRFRQEEILLRAQQVTKL